MKTSIARFFLLLAAAQIALAQPTVPVSNLYPVTANTLVGGGSTTGRGQTITAGSGIMIANGVISSTSASSNAPAAATYIVRTANATLTNAQALSSLPSGVVTVTTGTGVLASVVPGASGNILTSNGTGWASQVPAYTGNVTAAGTLASGNIVLGAGGKAIATSSVFSISGSNATVTGNLAITGSTTFNNLTTSNLTVSGNITATGVGNGTLLIGNSTGTKFDVGTLTAGDNISITNSAGGITINATGSGNVTGSGLTTNAIVVGGGGNAVTIGASPGTSGNVLTSNGTNWVSATAPIGNVTVSGTPTSGQLASWTSATNLQGITSANVTQGGTGVSTLTANAVITGNGTGSVTSVSPGTSGNVLTSNGTAWTSAAAATGNVTGSSLTANAVVLGTGGNGVTVIASLGTSGQPLVSAGAGAPPAFGALGASGGGTGQTTLTANNIITGNGTGAVTFIAPGTSGNIVTSNGTAFNSTAPVWFGNALVSGCTTVSANSTGNITFASANSNLTLTTDNTTKQIMFNVTGGGGSGNVTGPGSSTDRSVATWNSTGGTALRDNSGATIDASSNFVTSGNVTNNQTIAKALRATGGSLAANTASTTSLDYVAISNVARWFSQGPDTSTNGGFQVESVRSNGTNSVIVFSYSPASGISLGASIIGNTTQTGGPRAPYFVVDATTTNPGGLGANKSIFDHFSATSVSRWFSYGANGSTNGTFALNSQRSDGTNSINVVTTDTSGNVQIPTGDLSIDTIGKTLKIKSGSNAKAGTVTLSSGAGTISSTAITANSVLSIWLKTASGSITAHPYATAVTVGTSYTIAAGAGDNSTYNWAIVEIQ